MRFFILPARHKTRQTAPTAAVTASHISASCPVIVLFTEPKKSILPLPYCHHPCVSPISSRHRSSFGAKSFVVFDLHGFLLFL
ncbi:MAG: hypothetical protein IJI45_07425, partial [Anaerolineaceae bacterium]|nr:hypothetical protein [Anaerolineaceae bacterium]